MSNMLCRAKSQPPNGKEVEHTFRWSVRRVPWHRVRDAHHMQPVTRETHSSQATGTHRQLKWHRLAMACRVVGRLDREKGGGRFASQIPEFLYRRRRWCGYMNTRSRDIAQLMLTFSSARETQLRCQLHRQDRAPHDPATVRYILYVCITELAI